MTQEQPSRPGEGKPPREKAAEQAWAESHEGLRDRDQDKQIRENLEEAEKRVDPDEE